MGLEKTREDFGQTLGVWGMGTGAYIVWPFFGPSSVRDSIGLPMDIAASPATVINDGAMRCSLTALNAVNTRANLLGATRVLDDIALDKYTFIRDAYLQRRRSLVFDGNEPPPEDPTASRTRRRIGAAVNHKALRNVKAHHGSEPRGVARL